jgi:hypothetical protein
MAAHEKQESAFYSRLTCGLAMQVSNLAALSDLDG